MGTEVGGTEEAGSELCGGQVRGGRLFGKVGCGGAVVGGAVVVEFSTIPLSCGSTNDSARRSLVAATMKLCQITAGSEPPCTVRRPWMFTSFCFWLS